ncbi:MAG: ABC transporter ATP-binding protein [Bacteroides sp.]|nr:ABC transporter ATP-binding protein [Ruminococcus flavefaciens]MCM1555695.1 ABC transporter ATP-binding protein [Bacteroides sp.]
MNYLLETQGVVKRYGAYTALDHVSLRIPEGCIFGLLGPNGAGKTTLIRIINQITAPDEGSVLLNGEKLAQRHIYQVGYLPEERGLYRNMKVGDQAMYLAQLKGLSRAEAARRLHQWFEKFGIDSWWNKKVVELSKGMQQKIQFVVTVLHRPKLLIFDEPFSGFDPLNAQLLKDEILNLRREGSTVIFSTHNMASVEEICDEIALINKSRKVLDGKVEDIRRQFSGNVYHVSLRSEENLLEILRSELEVLECDRRDTPGMYDLKIRLPQDAVSGNAMLQTLMKYGDVKEFSEKLPSMNDIFIQTVKKAEENEK